MTSLIAFTIDALRCALPIEQVQRVLPMVYLAPLPEAPPIVLGVMNLHGELFPVVDLRRRLGRPARELRVEDRIVVATTRRRSLALPVDQVDGLVTVTPEEVVAPGAVVPGLGMVAGLVALPDGVLFIHDLDAFLSLDEERRLDGALEGVSRHAV